MSPCVEWQGATNGRYGVRSFWGKQCLAHRVAWAIAHGEWPALQVCHRCDNPLCVNVEHLFLGTQRDNMRDMMAKGRAVRYKRHGERNPRARLTRGQVESLRRDRETGLSYPKLGAKYGIGTSQAFRIVKGESWS